MDERGRGAGAKTSSIRTKLGPGRIVVVVTLAGYFALLLAIGGHDAWDRLGVPDLSPSFADTTVVTSAWECDREGIDVLPSNPCDPFGDRPANLPRLWLIPSALGVGQEATVPMGIAIAVLFFASFLILVGRASVRDGLIYAAAAASPAVMLGVERGNVDLVIFALLVVAILLFAGTGIRRVTSYGLLLLAAVLKLFPAFAWGVLLRQPTRQIAVSATAMTALLGAYLLATADTTRKITQTQPDIVETSYGAGVAIQSFQLWAAGRPYLGPLVEAGDALTVLAVVAGVVLILALCWTRRNHADFSQPGEDETRLNFFVAGAGIYVASFAISQSFDYRLAFLLLTLPQLIAWMGVAASPVPTPRLTLAAVLATLWLSEPFSMELKWAFDEIFTWFLFVTLGTGLLLTTVWPLLRRVGASWQLTGAGTPSNGRGDVPGSLSG